MEKNNRNVSTKNKDWILQTSETRRTFAKSTWIPLRALSNEEKGICEKIGYVSEYFGCGTVALPPESIDIGDKLSWNAIGIGQDVEPYVYDDGHYKSIDQYEYNEKECIGLNLVFDYPQPIVGGRKWTLNPDLVVALGLIKEGNTWVRPEEDFTIVARELFDEKGNHTLIEIKKEYLLDYLAARNHSLRLSYYRQRVENIESLESSPYNNLVNHEEQRDNGQFELVIRDLEDVYGGSWALFRVWRTDIDEEEDAPVMETENDKNTAYENSQGNRTGFKGIRVAGEFWRDEWIHHNNISTRVRRDVDQTLPSFITETDGTTMASINLNDEDIGRWLWFRSNIINELLNHRGFSLEWYTAETGGIKSTSGYKTHFGINSSSFITVYARDIARLATWEQKIWAAYNILPEGKVSSELLSAQVKAQVAPTHAAEVLLFKSMELLEDGFKNQYNVDLFLNKIEETQFTNEISRFLSTDHASLLRLAKELIRVFSERINKSELKKLSTHPKKKDLGSNKLLEDILAQKIGTDEAREIFGVIVGTYDMRIGDAHPTSSKISDALKLAQIDENNSCLRQGEQLISNFGQVVWLIGKFLFEESTEQKAVSTL